MPWKSPENSRNGRLVRGDFLEEVLVLGGSGGCMRVITRQRDCPCRAGKEVLQEEEIAYTEAHRISSWGGGRKAISRGRPSSKAWLA